MMLDTDRITGTHAAMKLQVTSYELDVDLELLSKFFHSVSDLMTALLGRCNMRMDR